MRFRAAPFFLLVLGWTWACHIPFALAGWSVNDFPQSALILLGGLGPPVGAAVFIVRRHNPAYAQEYLARLTSFRRVSARRWLAAVGLPFLVVIGGVLLAGLLPRGAGWPLVRLDMDVVAGITPFYVLLMLLAPILEEVAWRGYGQDALQSRFRPVTASLILGFIWWLWHLPLFFMADTYQSSLGVGTPAFWDFAVWTVATTFVMTWLYNGTSGSVLAAVVYHFVLNLANEMVATGYAADFARTSVQVALGLFLVVLLPRLRWGGGGATGSDVWRPGVG